MMGTSTKLKSLSLRPGLPTAPGTNYFAVSASYQKLDTGLRRYDRVFSGSHDSGCAWWRGVVAIAAIASSAALFTAPVFADSSCGPFAPLAASAVLAATAANASDSFYLADLTRIERGQSREVIADINARLKRGTVAGDVYTAAVLAAALSAEGLDTEARVVAEKAIADARARSVAAEATVSAIVATVYLRIGLMEEGSNLLVRAAQQYAEGGDTGNHVSALLNLARATRNPDEKTRHIRAIAKHFASLGRTTAGRRMMIETAQLALQSLPDADVDAMLDALDQLARTHDDATFRAARHDLRARRAENNRAFAASLAENDAALNIAARNALPISPDWLWLRARALRALGRDADAREVYRDLTARLAGLKAGLDNALLSIGSSYRERYGGAYLEYADLLLSYAKTTKGADQQTLLRRARDVSEFSKVVEASDYFRDPCIGASVARQTVESADRSAVTLYPIVFDDRIELLLTRQSEITQVSVPVSRAELVKTIGEYRVLLERRTTRQYLRPSRKLYDLLIRPIASLLPNANGATLVIVPDSILRTMPFAALHDGEKFLVERIALGTTISLSLTNPRKIETQDLRASVLGITEARLGFSELPAVKEETGRISPFLKTAPQLDQRFTRQRLIDGLSRDTPSIVHIASHGQFSTDPRDSFLLTYDERMTIDTLRNAVAAGTSGNHSLELLMLSACQTAAGDERSAMGLAGVALRSGARSALASLWYVNDDSTAELSARFYENLISRHLTRASALREAQVAMIADVRYAHPAYWAPFLMIGSWL